MNNVDKLKYYIKVIRRSADLIEELLEEQEDIDIDAFLRQSPQVRQQPPAVPVEEPRNLTAQAPITEIPPQAPVVRTVEPAKPIMETPHSVREKHVHDLLSIDSWPPAAEDYLVTAITNEERINSANATLDTIIDTPIEGVNFLDFGCGDGWIARQALKRGAIASTGYDIISSDQWKQHTDVSFTNLFKELTPSSYDIIVLYDVLDHCQCPEDVMQQVRSLIKPNGMVHLRCHPWTSRHASHLFKKGLNKSHIHLFLTWEELAEQGYPPEFTRQETDPITAYHWWFENGGFNIVSEKPIREPISEFFFGGDFKNLIMNEQNLQTTDMDRFYSDMEINFVDYILTPK